MSVQRWTCTEWGVIEARRLAVLCTLRLAMDNAEADIPTVTAGRLVVCGRPASLLRERVVQLLAVAQALPDGWIVWD